MLVALDTSIIVAALRGDPEVRQRLTTIQGVITATVVGELFVGAYLAAESARQLQYALPLVTRDAHFQRVPGLVVERW